MTLRSMTCILCLCLAAASIAHGRTVVSWTEMPEWAPPGDQGHHPTSGDLDGDGDADLLLTRWLTALENTGAPTSPSWAITPEWTEGIDPCYSAWPELADLDDDGDWDLLMGCFYNEIIFYENVGGPEAPAWQRNDAYFYYYDYDAMLLAPGAGDLDGDGDLDIVTGTASGGELGCFWNDGSPEDPSWRVDWAAFDEIHPAGSRIDPNPSDLDGDGDLDLVTVPESGSGYPEAFENVGTATQPVWQVNPELLLGVVIPWDCQGACFPDLNGDARSDMVFFRTWELHCYRNDGPVTAVAGAMSWSVIKALFR